MRVLTFDSALEELGFGRFQSRLLWICGLGWAADAMEVMLISFAMPAMATEWGLAPAQKAFLATAIFLGMFVGALLWGRLGDLVGRKACFISTIAVFSVFGFASAFAPTFGAFIALRFLTGIGVGGTLPVDYAMFSEYLPTKKRGRNLVLLEAFWALGAILAAGLAWAIVPRLGWRALFIASAVPAFLLLAIRRGVPESPRFLASRGRLPEVRAVLDRIAAGNGKDLGEYSLAEPTYRSVYGEEKAEYTYRSVNKAEGRKASSWSLLLAPGARRTSLLLWAVWFLISIGYYGAFTWLPSYFRAKGFSLLSVYPNAFFMALVQLPGYFTAAALVERWGRRKTLGVYLLGSSASAILFALSPNPGTVLASAALLSFFALGAWGALYAFTPECYPTGIRTTGVGTASGFTRIAGAIAPSLGALSLGNNTLLLPLSIFAVAYCIAGLLSFAFPGETAGKDIQ